MTGTNHDPDVDQLLRDAGAQWRASLPPNVDHYPELERRASRSRTLGLGGILGSLAGVLAVMIVAVLVVVSMPPHDPGIAGATPTPSRSSALPGAWRLLGTARVATVDGGLDQAYNVRAATTGEQWQELWQAADHFNPPPTVDLSREILVSFTHGVGSSCPDLRLDDIVIDLPGRTIYSVVSNPLGNIACTADLVGGVVFVVAIDRAALPQSPFTVQLDAPGRCAGLTCVAVDVDIAAAATPTTPTPTAVASENTAEASCSAILDNIPLVRVNSGKPTLAAAFEVTGAQLTTYFVKNLDADPNQTNGSDWWGQTTKRVDMCLYDGDFETMTPGPRGHDTSAARVLVVISNGDAQFWASTLNKASIPAVDPAAAITPTPTPAELTADEAMARVVAFVDDASLTGDLTATGPTRGASMRYYEVSGTHLSASVDANTGAITTLLFTNMPAPGPNGPTRAEAVATAKAFAVVHGIRIEGMVMAVEKKDHGETWEWVVKWARYAGEVLLPDTLEVGVDPSGQVWRWVSFSRPYTSPPPAKIDRATAEAAAIQAAFADEPQSRVDSAQLTLKVDANGKQRLVWDIQVASAHAQPSGPLIWNYYAWVEVDAETGAAVVVAVG